MPGPAGADDPALEQARLAQLAPHAYLDGWRGRNALAASADAPPWLIPENILAMAPTATQVESISARPGLVRTRVEDGVSQLRTRRYRQHRRSPSRRRDQAISGRLRV
jgi:hypothetical protein